MRTRTFAALTLCAALAVTGCGLDDPEVITDADPQRPAAEEVAADDTTETEPGDSAGEPQPAGVGGTITLDGSEVSVEVTVRRVLDPAPPDEFSAPDAGMRLVAVEVSLHNVGDAAYDDSPSNGMTLIDSEHREYSSTFASTPECADLSGGVTLVTGDTRVGCVTFEVPEAAAPTALQMALDSGFAGTTGRWDLTIPGEAGPPPPSSAAGVAVGETVTLDGSDVTVAVTVTRVLDPAPGDEFSIPRAGHRFVSVEVSLHNTGDGVYDDSPGNGAELIDANYAQHHETFHDTTECPGFAGGTTIAPGDTRVGCLTFQVPEGAAPGAFQFSLDSGFAAQTGRWTLS